MNGNNNVTRKNNNTPSKGPHVVVINVTPVGTKTNWGWKLWTLFRDYILRPIVFVLWTIWQHRKKVIWITLGLVGLYIVIQLGIGAISLARDGWHKLLDWIATLKNFFGVAVTPTSWGRIGVVAILFLLSTGFFWWRVRKLWKKTRTPVTPTVSPTGAAAPSTTSSEEPGWVNALWLFGSWGFILLVAAPVLAEHLAPNYGWNWWFWTVLLTPMGGMLVTAFIIMGWMTKENKKSRFRWTMAQTSIYILTVIALAYIGSSTKVQWSSWVAPSTTTGNASFTRPTSCPDVSTVMKRTYEIWTRALPSEQARRMVNAAFRESSGRFCDKGGNILLNPQNHDAMGTMGIKLSLHQKKAEELGLNLYDFEDHMKFAVWLYRRDGEAPWKESLDYLDSLEVEVTPLIAKVGEWTEEVEYGPMCWEEPAGPVMVRNERGQVTQLPPWEKRQPQFYASKASYSAKSGEPVQVLFKCLPE